MSEIHQDSLAPIKSSVWFKEEVMSFNTDKLSYQGNGCFGIGDKPARQSIHFYSQLADLIMENEVNIFGSKSESIVKGCLRQLAIHYHLAASDNADLCAQYFWDSQGKYLIAKTVLNSDDYRDMFFMLADDEAFDFSELMQQHITLCRSLES